MAFIYFRERSDIRFVISALGVLSFHLGSASKIFARKYLSAELRRSLDIADCEVYFRVS